MPKITLIIAVYNVEKYLKQCLDSIINQTFKDIEIICADDCSTDNSSNILKEYAQKDSRFVIINQEQNEGPGCARNKALLRANGEFIMFVDPDDWLEPNACESAYNQISKNNNDVVFFGHKKFYEDTSEFVIDNSLAENFKGILNENNFDGSNLPINYFKAAYTWSQIYARDFIKKHNIEYSQTYLCEDIPFTLKMISGLTSASILNSPIYNYRIRKTSLSNSLKTHWEELFYNRYLGLEIIKNSNNKQKYINHYLIYMINTTYYWYKKISQNFPSIKKNYYNKMRELFTKVSKEYNIEEIEQHINIKQMHEICNTPWEKLFFKNLAQSLFEITNLDNNKIITIFGIKLKLKRK